MRVSLTPHARDRLRKIYEYYKDKKIEKVGRKIRTKVLQKTMKLKEFPYMGSMEPNLVDSEFEYRYLVEGNYKVIYRVVPDLDLVIVNDIFDTRQNPDIMG